MRTIALVFAVTGMLAAQEDAPAGQDQDEAAVVERVYHVQPGARVPLGLINTVSTRNAIPGDRVYFETVFPVVSDNKIVIPPGSYVIGTVTQVKKPGRVKGRGELYVRFDSLTLPNGVTRDFRATISGLDGESGQQLDREEGTVRGDTDKAGDLRTVGQTASIGATAGGLATRSGTGLGVGAAAGAAAGLAGVLLGRGPDAVLARGTTVEMVLDRDLAFTESELEFDSAGTRRPQLPAPARAQDEDRSQGLPFPGQIWALP